MSLWHRKILKMEIEQYICPNCNVRLRKSIWEQVYKNYINGSMVTSYEGICRSCRNKFSFFVDDELKRSLFWQKIDEKILEDNNRVVGCSVKVLYALRKNRFIETLKKFENKPKCSRTLIIVPQDFCDLINKYDVIKIGNIIFIDKHILETRFDQNYPCILAEKNIMELVKKWEKYTLYSDTKTYYDFFNLGE